MTNYSIVVNTTNKSVTQAKANGTTGDKVCVHTVRAEDLMKIRPAPGQGGLSLALKLKG